MNVVSMTCMSAESVSPPAEMQVFGAVFPLGPEFDSTPDF